MRVAALIANPSASKFTGAGFRRVVAELSDVYDVTPVWPAGPAAARSAAADAAADGVDVVFAMGGDGVVHHVANGLIGTGTALGVLPAGTTNVVARVLGLPTKLLDAARLAHDLEPRRVNVAHVATESATAARSEHAVFALGIGFDADVVAIAEQRPYSKNHFGTVHYARTTIGRVAAYRGRLPSLRVECDGTRADAVAVLVQIHDAYTFLGRFPLRLAAETGTGITAVAITDVTVMGAARIVGDSLFRRNVEAAPSTVVFRDFEKLIVEADPPAPFQADGEHLGDAHSFEVAITEGGLLVLAPGDEE